MKVSGMSNLEMLNNGGGKRRGRKRKPDPDVAAATGESNSIMKYLANEIKLDILSRLPIPSVLNCKLVCKNWRETIQNPTFGNTHLRRALLGQQQQQLNDRDSKVSFLLLTLEEKTRIYNGYYFENRKSPEEIMELQRYEDLWLTEEGRRQIESGEYFEDRKPSVEFKIINHPLIKKHSGTGAIVGSCNGLVCISIPYTHHIDDPIYICNPTLGEKITLPRFTLMAKNKNNVEYKKTTYLDGHLVSGFGYNTKTDEFKVVRIHYFVSRRSELSKGQVQVYTLGSGKEICSPWRGILADGALHWLDEEWNIVAFELAEEEFSLLPSPTCFRPGVVNFFTLQGHNFNFDMRLLALRGCDMVLGVDWMKNISLVKFDFKKMTITFTKDGEEVTLLGNTEAAKISLMSGSAGKRYFNKDRHGIMGHL
ncbi:F-box protein At3g07870-like [Papaver somniferum]|uniref:F-box protein At3g07870-like n=1 Tax=Papaver somniferum TaxID=3469 RepID=UPI000E6FF376|nr:F-box protein At3g07870-like [Papaver somniferum]